MPKPRGQTQPWTEWLTRPQPDGPDEFSLACAHGAVTTEEVRFAFAPDFALGVFYVLKRTHALTAEEAALATARELLGRLLTERSGCRCARRGSR